MRKTLLWRKAGGRRPSYRETGKESKNRFPPRSNRSQRIRSKTEISRKNRISMNDTAKRGFPHQAGRPLRCPNQLPGRVYQFIGWVAGQSLILLQNSSAEDATAITTTETAKATTNADQHPTAGCGNSITARAPDEKASQKVNAESEVECLSLQFLPFFQTKNAIEEPAPWPFEVREPRGTESADTRRTSKKEERRKEKKKEQEEKRQRGEPQRWTQTENARYGQRERGHDAPPKTEEERG